MLQIGPNRWMNGDSAGSTHLPAMDDDGQANAIGHHETHVEREVDPIANHPAIDYLATGPGKGEDEKPERRPRRRFVAGLPLSERLNPESWKQEKGATPTQSSTTAIGRGMRKAPEGAVGVKPTDDALYRSRPPSLRMPAP